MPIQTIMPGSYKIEMPELKNYFGSKFGCGMYQNIINLIPPHFKYYELFGGSLAVFRNKRAAVYTHLNDLDPKVHSIYVKYLEHSNIQLSQMSAITIIDQIRSMSAAQNDFIYLDPPYIESTRRSTGQYSCEMTTPDHIKLLNSIQNHPAMIMISHYPNRLYDQSLHSWNCKTFPVMTRNGWQIEKVYYNYVVQGKLHDYQHLGTNFTDRQRIKRKIYRLKSKLSRLPVLERAAVIDMIKSL